MKTLSVAGTMAMFLVGGGIVAHGLPALQRLIDKAAEWVEGAPGVGGLLGELTSMVLDGALGALVGAVVMGLVGLARKVLPRRPLPAA